MALKPSPKITANKPGFTLPWFEADIPVTLGLDNLLFRMGKLLVESYYNGFLRAQKGFEDHVAVYFWGDIDESEKTVHLSASVGIVINELKNKNGKINRAKLNGAERIKLTNKATIKGITMLDTHLLRKDIFTNPSHVGGLEVLDLAPVKPPAPGNPPPPTL